jgi:ubiquinone biosynthesis protein UbiJ
MFFTLLCALVEQLLNQALKLDNDLISNLASSKNKRLVVELTDIKQSVSILFDGKQFHFFNRADGEADCKITSNLDTLMELKDPALVTSLIRQGRLDLEGDIKLAQHYSGAFAALDIDWADKLSPYLGDAASFNLVKALKKMALEGKQQLSKSQTSFTQLLQDELKVAIHPLEAKLFKNQTRETFAQVEQLEQRINQLTQKVTGD